MMAAYALDAVEHARTAFQRELDFSGDSVRHVEEILSAMHDAMPRGFLSRLFGRGPSQEDVWSFSKIYGGYIGEVLRRAGGGEWFLDEEILPGQRSLALRKGDRRLWPPFKVGKRLTNGAEDNVWHYFQVVAKEW
jgi:hypothetical protein